MSGFDRKKAFLILQAVLCVCVAVLLAAAAVRIDREGAARRAEHPLEPVYTPENTAEALMRVSPVFFVSLGMTAAGLLLGIRDDRAPRPVRDPAKARRKAPAAGKSSRRTVNAVRVILLTAAVILILLGAVNGSLRDVLMKAINICTECVGLG